MSTNSRNGFMGWIQKNPGTAFAIFLVFAAIVTVIVMVSRRSTASAGPGAASGLPVLEVSGTKVVKSTKTSGYAIRRYEYLGKYLGDNIDFTITVNTKSGFEQNDINRLKVYRYGPPKDTTSTTNVLLGTKIIDNVRNYTSYEVTFFGSELEEDAVTSEGGKQFFEVIGFMVTTADDGSETETEYTVTSPLAMTPIGDGAPKISKADINYVLKEATFETFDWTVTDASDVIVQKSTALRSEYSMSIDTTKTFYLIPVPNETNLYTFQDANDSSTLFTVGTTTQFKLDRPKPNEPIYFLYSTDGKMVTRAGGSGDLVLKDPKQMIGAEYDTARIEIREIIPGMSPTRVYPPTPFPSVTTGPQVLDVSHEVTGAAYGNGTYRATISGSYSVYAAELFDIDTLFDEGPGAPIVFAGENKPAYHSVNGTAAGDPTWLHFYLPQAIYLDRLEIFPRHYGPEETLGYSQNYAVYGIVREGGGDPQQTELFNNAQVTVEFQKKIILRMTDTSKKFSEFKVVFVPKEGSGTIIQEMVFMGHEEV